MFTPDKMKHVAKMSLSMLIHTLDTCFQRKVDDGWVTDYFEHKIYVQFPVSDEAGKALLAYRDQVQHHYLSVGWSDVLIQTSEEQGERPGSIRIELHVPTNSESVQQSTLDVTDKVFLQKFLTAFYVTHESADPLYDEDTSLEELEEQLSTISEYPIWPFNFANVVRFLSKQHMYLKKPSETEAIDKLVYAYGLVPEKEVSDENMMRMFIAKTLSDEELGSLRMLIYYGVNQLEKMLADQFHAMGISGEMPFNRMRLVRLLSNMTELHVTDSDEQIVEKYISFLELKLNRSF